MKCLACRNGKITMNHPDKFRTLVLTCPFCRGSGVDAAEGVRQKGCGVVEYKISTLAEAKRVAVFQ